MIRFIFGIDLRWGDWAMGRIRASAGLHGQKRATGRIGDLATGRMGELKGPATWIIDHVYNYGNNMIVLVRKFGIILFVQIIAG